MVINWNSLNGRHHCHHMDTVSWMSSLLFFFSPVAVVWLTKLSRFFVFVCVSLCCFFGKKHSENDISEYVHNCMMKIFAGHLYWCDNLQNILTLLLLLFERGGDWKIFQHFNLNGFDWLIFMKIKLLGKNSYGKNNANTGMIVDWCKGAYDLFFDNIYWWPRGVWVLLIVCHLD